MHFTKSFCLRSDLSDDDIIPAYRPDLKTGYGFYTPGTGCSKVVALSAGQIAIQWTTITKTD